MADEQAGRAGAAAVRHVEDRIDAGLLLPHAALRRAKAHRGLVPRKSRECSEPCGREVLAVLNGRSSMPSPNGDGFEAVLLGRVVVYISGSFYEPASARV